MVHLLTAGRYKPILGKVAYLRFNASNHADICVGENPDYSSYLGIASKVAMSLSGVLIFKKSHIVSLFIQISLPCKETVTQVSRQL
jgi:hypothetical protein